VYVYQISSKSDDFWLRYGDLNTVAIFKMAAVRHLGFLKKSCSFCHVALTDMPFCFLIQNFAEIKQSVDELWPNKRFSRWRLPPSWVLKISIFGHVTVFRFNICYSVPNFINIGRFLSRVIILTRDIDIAGPLRLWYTYTVIIIIIIIGFSVYLHNSPGDITQFNNKSMQSCRRIVTLIFCAI